MQTLFPNRLSAQVQQREAIRKQCSIPLKPLRMNSGCALTEHISDSRLLLCSWGTDSALHNLRLLQGGGSTHSVLNNLGLLAYSANSVLHSLGLLCCSANSALHNLMYSRYTLVKRLPNLWQVRCGIH